MQTTVCFLLLRGFWLTAQFARMHLTMDIIRANIGKIKEMLEENDNG